MSNLNPTEAHRVAVILNEAIKKLDIINLLNVEEHPHKEELSDLVNDEISRIIEEQRRLQIKYQELIMQRSMLKNVTNKAKYKEIQTEIEETATALRYATKVLCRNLKENPDVAENVSKIQQERLQMYEVFVKLQKEISESGSCKSLSEFVEADRKKAEEVKTGNQKVKQTLLEIRQLQEEITDAVEERKRDETAGNAAIQRLQEELQETRANTILESKYQKKESKARLDAARRVYFQKEKNNESELTFLNKRIEVEERVNIEATSYLERKYEKLQQQTEYWDSKWEVDTDEKEKEIQDLKNKKAADLMKLMELKQKYKETNDMFLKEKRLREAKLFAKEMSTKRTEAAKIIQNTFRQYQQRKQAQDKYKKLKKADTKGKKKGKGKKAQKSPSKA